MEESLNMPPQVLLLMWCSEGLECCVNITAIDKQIMWETMKGQESKVCLPNLNSMMLRARYNPQRFYEIYTISVDHTITADDVADMFYENPQAAADLIRERGRQLYSDRRSKERIV
jgi:cytidylate kinase